MTKSLAAFSRASVTVLALVCPGLASAQIWGFTLHGCGHYDKALEAGQEAIALDPDFAIGYTNRFCISLPEPSGSGRGGSSEGIGTQD